MLLKRSAASSSLAPVVMTSLSLEIKMTRLYSNLQARAANWQIGSVVVASVVQVAMRNIIMWKTVAEISKDEHLQG